ncbi:MAG TPA: phosphotransferase [Woeseiaceae bacterium]
MPVQNRPEDALFAMRGIARTALRHWKLQGAELDLLKHRENAVFRVDAGGERYALRVHRPGYHSDAALRSELQWMEALREAGVDVPRIVPTTSAEPFALENAPGLPSPVQVDLFEWIEGRPLGSVERGVATDGQGVRHLYRSLGVLAAALHDHSEAWNPPRSFVRHAWDESGLAGERPLWGPFLDLPQLAADERELLTVARARVYDELGTLSKARSGYGLIHADFTPENVLVDGGRPRLIDFDDAGWGWHLFELVTPLFFLMEDPCFHEARDALVDGYRERRRLDEEQLARLPLFFLARAFTYLGWVHTRSETATARELTPMLVATACRLAAEYLRGG